MIITRFGGIAGLAVLLLAGACASDFDATTVSSSVSNRDDDLKTPVDSTPNTLTTVDSLPDTLPATTVEVVPVTLPAITVEVVPVTLPAITVEVVPDTLAAMWPQSSIDEVRQAQLLADAGDPAYPWQVDPRLTSLGTDRLSIDSELELRAYLRSPGAAIVERYIREGLGWQEFLYNDNVGVPDGLRNLMYLRCAPGEKNPLYPTAWDGNQEAPGGHRCAPTLDEFTYEAVILDLARPDREGLDGILVVIPRMRSRFTQADPSVVEAKATVRLEQWLQARIDGVGAEGYVETFYLFGGPDDVQLLYATTTGAPYERYEIERVGQPVWPYGQMDFMVRLFAEGGATVVEQHIFLGIEQSGRKILTYTGDTTENGQRVPIPET